VKKIIAVLIFAAALAGMQTNAIAMELTCDMGRRVMLTGDQHIDSVIELFWQGRAYAMHRVSTSTGANRFEHAGSGLLWIGIPAKGMLLDTKRSAPLANECKMTGR
jgi:hypothetical protein